MYCKQLSRVIIIFGIFLFQIFSFNVYAQKEMYGSRDIKLGIETIPGDEKVNSFIQDHINEILEYVYETPEIYGLKRGDDIIICKPFVIINSSTGDTIEHIYYYAVLNNGKVSFIITGFIAEDGSINYTLTNWLVDKLNYITKDNLDRKIYITYYNNDAEPKIELKNTNKHEHSSMDLVWIDFNTVNDTSDKPGETEINSGVISYSYTLPYLQSLVTNNTPGSGFLVNQQGSHVTINTNYKLVLQGSYNCALACIASIYRVRTNTTIVNCDILDEFNDRVPNNPYNYGTTDGQVGLLNYLMPYASPYYHYSGFITHFLTMHNINNGYPFIMGAAYYELNGEEHQHAFMIRGYQYTQGTYSNMMRYEYFNPWGYVESTSNYFTNSASIIFSSGGQIWYELTDHCLQYPGHN